MNEKDWMNQEENFYRTGTTRPKKSKSGPIAVLLGAVIFLGGIISLLGLFDIHLFDFTRQNRGTYVQFTAENPTQQDQSVVTEPTQAKSQLELNNSPASVENIPQEGGLSLQEIYTKAIDSVVSISCSAKGGASTGTGVVLSADGYIITNYHVVEGAQTISALLTDGRELPATLVGKDDLSDLAILSVQATDLTPAEFGDSSALRVGDTVVAIGDPLGIELRGTMTNGIVSAINRDIATGGRTMTLIQTNAALNNGNSGGPLLNCYGQVVGINTMKIGDYMSDAGVEGLGFAIPSTTVKEIVDQLLSQGYISGRPSLGFEGQSISSFHQIYYRFPKGVYINKVEEGSDAAAKGIRAGDILLRMGNTRITDTEQLATLLYAYEAGAQVKLVVYRNGQELTLQITLGEAK